MQTVTLVGGPYDGEKIGVKSEQKKVWVFMQRLSQEVAPYKRLTDKTFVYAL